MRRLERKDPFATLIEEREWRKIAFILASTAVIGVAAASPCTFSPAQASGPTAPRSGSHFHLTAIVVTGKAKAGAVILKDESMAPDPTVTKVNGEGRWSCVWRLSPGKNTIRFHTKDHEDHIELTVYRDEPAIAAMVQSSLPSCGGSYQTW
jgi:hypothetical protein